MPVSPAGILTEKQAEIFYDLAERVRDSGAFGSQTVLDDPDQFAADPLVQLSIALTASQSDCWLALEWLQNQFNPLLASGRFLNEFHLARYGINDPLLTESAARALLLQLQKNGVKPFSPEAAVMRLASVQFAKAYYSKPLALVDGLNAGESMLVIKGAPAAGEVAQALFEGIGDGLYNWVGDVQDTYNYLGNCHPYRYQPAQRVVVAVQVRGNLNECTSAAWHDIANKLITQANCQLQFDFGAKIDGQKLIQLLGQTPGININSLAVQRRARKLTGSECIETAETLTFIECDGTETTEAWESDKICGYAQGEFWCPNFEQCLQLKPWEYATFHADFFEFIEENSAC